jgi:hypothetical protein
MSERLGLLRRAQRNGRGRRRPKRGAGPAVAASPPSFDQLRERTDDPVGPDGAAHRTARFPNRLQDRSGEDDRGATGSLGLSEHRSAVDDATSVANGRFRPPREGTVDRPDQFLRAAISGWRRLPVTDLEERGLLSMRVDPPDGRRPGELSSVPLSPSSHPSQELFGRAARLREAFSCSAVRNVPRPLDLVEGS